MDSSDQESSCQSMEYGSSNAPNYSMFTQLVNSNSNTPRPDSPILDELPSDDEILDKSDGNISSHLKGNLSFGIPTNNESTPRKVLKTFTSDRLVYKGLPMRDIQGSKKINKSTKLDEELKDLEIVNQFSEELRHGYLIFNHLMSARLSSYNESFLDAIRKGDPLNQDYLEVIPEPIGFNEIKKKLLDNGYPDITSLIADIRSVFENTYRYYGPVNSQTKRALHLEYVLQQQISRLPESLQELCTLKKTHPSVEVDESELANSKSSRILIKGRHFTSHLLFNVKGCRLAREKVIKLRKLEARKEGRRLKELEISEWESNLTAGLLKLQMESSWELPQVGQFLTLALPVLNIPEISQYELERCLLIPESSMALRMIFTTLVSSPTYRTKITEKPYMPYNTWAKKLANKTCQWYKMYQKEHQNPDKVFESLGIEQGFWEVCGQTNPFQTMLFHEMSFCQRLWLLKSMCDHVAHNHKSIQEFLSEQSEDLMREVVLGTDEEDNDYLYFPQFINLSLRIYKRAPLPYEKFEIKEEEKTSMPKLFTKEQLKQYKILIKNSRMVSKKRKIEDDEWFQSQTSKKKAKRKSAPPKIVTITPVETRTRPTNLRQRPKMRFTEDLSSDDELLEPPRMVNRRSRQACLTSPGSESSEVSEAEESGNEIPVKSTRSRRSFGRKKSCQKCGKTFTSIGSLNGHMAVHSKSRSRNASREPTPLPNKIEDGSLIESPIKKEEEDIKKEVETKENGITSDETTDCKNSIENMKEEMDPIKEEIPCSMKEEQSEEGSVKSRESSAEPSFSLGIDKGFALVVTDVEGLRNLIHKFGPVPAKASQKEKAKSDDLKTKDNEEDEKSDSEQKDEKPDEAEGDAEKYTRKLSKNEQLLYDSLRNLYLELLPSENRFRSIQKQEMKKLYNEQSNYKKRTPSYVDSADEAWMSEPELPVPSPAVETPKVSSSSSSSEDEYYDDGIRKRKLRKRKAKRNANSSYVTSPEPTPVPSPLYEDESERLSISSRGRIRRQRKMVDYDQLDFDKLAEQADRNDTKKKGRNASINEVDLHEAASKLSLPSNSVKKYVFGAKGDVCGYIDNNNKYHCREGAVKMSAVRPISSIKQDLPDPNPPVLIITALDSQKSNVCIKIQGNQALKIGETLKQQGPGKHLKINHNNQIFIINSSDSVLTKHIPGFPDCDISSPVDTLAKMNQAKEAVRRTQAQSVSQNCNEQTPSVSQSCVQTPTVPHNYNQQNPSVSQNTLQSPSVSQNYLQTTAASQNSIQGQSITQNITSPPSTSLSAIGNGRPMQVTLAGQNRSQTLYAVQTSTGFTLRSPNNIPLRPAYTVRQQHEASSGYVRIQPSNPVIVKSVIPQTSVQTTPIIVKSNFPQTSVQTNPVIVKPVIPQTSVQSRPQNANQPIYITNNIQNNVVIHAPEQQPQTLYIQQTAQPQPQPVVAPKQKFYILQTDHGQKVCLHTQEGKLVALTNEQLAPLIKNGKIKLPTVE